VTVNRADFDNYISQGSVATCPRCDGIFNDSFIANFPENVSVKDFLNLSIFDKDVYKSIVSAFLTRSVLHMYELSIP